MNKDCDCDDGIRDNGICEMCEGRGWYPLLSPEVVQEVARALMAEAN